MKEIIDVQTGQVRADNRKVILKSKAIGSCIAVIAYDSVKNIGAIAHVMLPGRAPLDKKPPDKTKYAFDAIEAMLSRMSQLGSKTDDIEVVMAGGGNVLNRKDDTICKENIESAMELLKKKHLKIKAQAVGGTNRRSVSLDIERGIVYYSEGNGSETQLWRAHKID